jgi:hypothetical protein
LGITRLSKSQVSTMAAELDAQVTDSGSRLGFDTTTVAGSATIGE